MSELLGAEDPVQHAIEEFVKFRQGVEGVRPEEVPDWWPPDQAPVHLKAGWFYKDRDGHWRDHEGHLVSRAERRKAGIR